MTVASVAFLAVVVVCLLLMQTHRSRETVIARPLPDGNQPDTIRPLAGTSVLPAPRLGGNRAVTNGGDPNRIDTHASVGGMGLQPDTPTDHRTIPTLPAPQASYTPNRPTDIPPAAVQQVQPITGAAPTAGSIPGSISYTTLSGGMRLASVQSQTADSASALVIAGTAATSGTLGNFREEAVRNIYRAARNAFALNESARHATVYIQTDTTEKGGTVLASADIDRDAALKSDPETGPSADLERHLASIQWQHP